MASVERLLREHTEIAALANELLEAIPTTEPAMLREMLIELDVIIANHLKIEDTEVYPHLAEGKDLLSRAHSFNGVGDFHKLSSHWAEFVAQWGAQQIEDEPKKFASECGRLLAALQERSNVEDEILYPIALSSGAMTLREFPGQM